MGLDHRLFTRYTVNQMFSMRIKKIDARSVSTGESKVVIKDIGTGGLSFISFLDLPLNRSIYLEFDTIYGKINGYIVWRHKSNAAIHYGVKFTSSQNKLYQLLGFS